jgi:hypothetical protein
MLTVSPAPNSEEGGSAESGAEEGSKEDVAVMRLVSTDGREAQGRDGL